MVRRGILIWPQYLRCRPMDKIDHLMISREIIYIRAISTITCAVLWLLKTFLGIATAFAFISAKIFAIFAFGISDRGLSKMNEPKRGAYVTGHQ